MWKLASSIGLALAVADLKRRIQHWVRSGILGAIGAVLALIALCFFLVAVHLWLSWVLNPIGSALIIGGVLLVIALILFFVASRPLDARPVAAVRDDNPGAQLGDMLRDGASRLGGSNSPLLSPVFLASLAALAAGVIAGRRSKSDRRDDRDDDDD